MCGIVGLAGYLPEVEKIKRAAASIKHRGPDDDGLYYDKAAGIALAHRRLSIIDLSPAGHQPMESGDGRYLIIYNGEIYNYLEIKKELEDFYDFKTKTDTEVLLAAYIKWGESCLRNFNGMFAFAIWDKKNNRLFCARDRLGIKPFYYHLAKDRLVFASEIKAILELDIKPEANESIIFDYLYHGLYDHSRETFFRGIYCLLPGHFLVWQDNEIKLTKYWDLADLQPKKLNYMEGEAEDILKNLIADAIKLRFRSDVPVGLNLSSGLDSNSLYHYALDVTTKDIHTFSMCLDSDEYNECGLIEATLDSQKKKFWHTCYLNPPEVLSGAENMNLIQDQPYGGIPTIAYESLIKLSRANNIIVILEGQGVDEILAGYPSYKAEYNKDNFGQTKDNTGLGYGQDMTKLIYRDVLAKEFVLAHNNREPVFPGPFASHLLNAQYRDICYTKLPRVLRFNDQVTMRHGQELRLPFLDYRIVEFCFFLPPQYKIKDGSHKFILRKIMSGVIPEETNQRPKKVFGAIQTEWFKKYFKKEVYDMLNSQSFKNRKYWNQAKLKDRIGKFYQGEIDNSFFIWQCFNLELWFKRFIDGG